MSITNITTPVLVIGPCSSVLGALQSKYTEPGHIVHMPEIGALGFGDSSFGSVIAELGADAGSRSSVLKDIHRVVKADGSVHAFFPEGVDGSLELMMAGFLDTVNENGAFVGKKPSFEGTQTFAIKKADKADVASAWADNGDDADVIDEDSLVPEEQLRGSAVEVCADRPTAGKKACKDCTCGLAEKLEKEALQEKTPQSACGNCYLGDAFRCSTCPYRGLPAFKPGEKVALPTNMLDSDI